MNQIFPDEEATGENLIADQASVITQDTLLHSLLGCPR